MKMGRNVVRDGGLLRPRKSTFVSALCIFACLASSLAGTTVAHAEEVRLRYDARGNIVAIEDASAASALRVLSLDPSYGSPGDSIHVLGSAFATTTAANQVTIGGAAATVTEASPDHLVVTVPPTAASGPVQVTVGASTATSPDLFRLLPAAVPSSSVSYAYALEPGAAPRDVAALASKKLVLFYSAAVGDGLTLDILQWTRSGTGAVPVKVYGPAGSELLSLSLTDATPTLHLPVAQQAGVHAVVISPSGWLRATVRLGSDPVLVADAAAADFVIDRRYATRRYFVDAGPGDNLGIGMSQLTVQPASYTGVTVRLDRPDGQQIKNYNCYTNNEGCGIDLRQLTSTGLYALVISGNPSATRNEGKLWLSRDVAAPIALNASTPFSIVRPGQNLRYTFAGTAGQRIGIAGIAASTPPPTGPLTLDILTPAGTPLDGNWLSIAQGGWSVQTKPPLPATGTYTLIVDARNYDSSVNAPLGSGNIAVTSENVVAPVVADSAAVDLSTSAVGQISSTTFTVTAGESLGLGISDLALAPVDRTSTDIIVYSPNGSALKSIYCTTSGAGCAANLRNLAAGTYRVAIENSAYVTSSSAKVWLSHDTTGTASVGSSMTIPIARPGQDASYTFSGTAGQRIALASTHASVVPANASFAVSVIKPDGGCLFPGCWTSTYGGTWAVQSAQLPATGTYAVWVDGWNYTTSINAPTGEVTAVLSEESAASALTIDGPAVTLATPVRGQRASTTFVAGAQGTLGLGFSDIALQPAAESYVTILIHKADGSTLTTLTCYETGAACATNLTGLVPGATYRVLVEPQPSATSTSLKAWLSSPLQSTLVVGAPQTLAFDRVGQDAALTFAGAAGDLRRLNWSGVTTSATPSWFAIFVRHPDGSCVAGACPAYASAGVNGGVDLPPLPAAGTYAITIDQYSSSSAVSAFTGGMTLELVSR